MEEDSGKYKSVGEKNSVNFRAERGEKYGRCIRKSAPG